jgi:RNA polymerase sigma factor (TIGR02999 family)
MSDDDDITGLLQEWSAGSAEAFDELVRLLYEELKKAAVRQARWRGPDSTLTPTALLNEAYLKLVRQDHPNWQNRSQFLGVAVTVMRRVLFDHYRREMASKRPPKRLRVTLTPEIAAPTESEIDYLALHEALERLSVQDPELARLVELRWLAGMTLAEVAAEMGCSEAAIKRRWTLARAWLRRELDEADKTAHL